MTAPTLERMRALADELRHARFDGGFMYLSLSAVRDFVATLDAAADEADRVRSVIKNAPHWVSENDADDCCGWYSDDNYCNCWKRDAL